MNAAFAVASTTVSMQAVHEACYADSLAKLEQLDAHLQQLQYDRLAVTVRAAVAYLQGAGYRTDADVRALVIVDARDDFSGMVKCSAVSQEAAARVKALLQALLHAPCSSG